MTNDLNFIAIAQAGFDAWASKPHNAKWFRRVDGTPIPNDVVVCIAVAFSEAFAAQRKAPSAASNGLSPCPFCGGDPERVDLTDEENFGGSVICCKGCGASSAVHFDRKENLLDSWNRRAAPRSMANHASGLRGDDEFAAWVKERAKATS